MATITGTGRTDFEFETAAAGASVSVNNDGDTTGTLQSGSDGSAVDNTTFTSPTASFDVAYVGATIIIEGTSYTILSVTNSTTISIGGGTIAGSGLDWSIPTFSSSSAVFHESLIGSTIVVDDVVFTILDVIDANTLVLGDNTYVSGTDQNWSIPSLNTDPGDDTTSSQTFIDNTTVSSVRAYSDSPFYSGKSMAVHVFDDVEDLETSPVDYRTEGLLLEPTINPATTEEYDPATDMLDSPGITGRSRAIRQTINAPDLFDELFNHAWDSPQIHGHSKAIHVRLLDREPQEPNPPLPDWGQDEGYESYIFDDYNRGGSSLCDGVDLWTHKVEDGTLRNIWDIELPVVPGGILEDDVLFIHWTHTPVPDGPAWLPYDMPFSSFGSLYSIRKILDADPNAFYLWGTTQTYVIPGAPNYGKYLKVTASMDFIGQTAPTIKLYADPSETTKVAYVTGVLRGSTGVPGGNAGAIPAVLSGYDPVKALSVNDDTIKGGSKYLFLSFAVMGGNDDYLIPGRSNTGDVLAVGQGFTGAINVHQGGDYYESDGTYIAPEVHPNASLDHPAFVFGYSLRSEDISPYLEFPGVRTIEGYVIDDSTVAWGIQVVCV